MKVYIAGPMRGYPKFNHPAFDQAEKVLRSMGYDPVNPARLDRDSELNYADHDDIPNNVLRDIIQRDITALLGCEAVALLPGWNDSSGAKLEIATAQYVDMRVVEIPPELLNAS